MIMKDDEEEIELDSEGPIEVEAEREANCTEEPQTENHEEDHGIAEASLCFSVCNSQILKSTLTDMNMEKTTDSAPYFLKPLMFDDNNTEKSQEVDKLVAHPVSEINTEMKNTVVSSVLSNHIKPNSEILQPCFKSLRDVVTTCYTINQLEILVSSPFKPLNQPFSNSIITKGREESSWSFQPLANIGEQPPPPEPPDRITVLTGLLNQSLSVTTTESFAATHYSSNFAYILQQSTLQMFDQMPKGDMHKAFVDFLRSSWRYNVIYQSWLL
ncbi:hypothetical protein TSUD_240940 [Trifolium subterraneum]|uniref:Uncharacterized protein n=1 Tax=Trifolium subterraneum TaxID=3900 RepID=A0A2Z6P7J9_TRISU|nr:hypothetical protein TSUD_240940 [Trifolium subterraneum]